MQGFNTDLLEAADLFSAAAFDADGWFPALRRLAELTGSAHGQLLGVGSASNIPFNLVTDVSDRVTEDFVAIDGGIASVNPRIAASDRAGLMQLVTEEDLADARKSLTSTAYVDFAATHDIPFGCQMAVQKDDHGLVGLAVLRRACEGPTREHQRQVFSAIAPLVRMAVKTQIALENEGARLLADCLESMSAMAFVCDRNLRVLSRTPSTDALLAGGILKLQGDRLAAGESGTPALAIAVRSCAETPFHEGGTSLTVALGARPPSTPVVLDISRLPLSNDRFSRNARVLVIARKPARSAAGDVAALMAGYDLSRAEAEIALALLDGMDRREIAARRNVSEATVHSQMKAVFAKCGMTREAGLVALLARFLRG